MRTTIDISDDVLKELKRIAVESSRTLREVTEDTLRAGLAKRKGAARRDTSHTVLTFSGRGVRPGVNLDSTAELLDAMDGEA